MTANARLEKTRAILALLTGETRFAINMERMFARCADKADVLDAFSYEPELWGFQVTRDALHMSLLVTLGRIHGSGRGNAASFDSLRECLEDPQVHRLICGLNEQDADANIRLNAVLKAMANPGLRELVEVLREIRDKRIAHRDHIVHAYRARYGDERRLIEQTVPIIRELGRLVFGIDSQLMPHQFQTEQLADRFWRTMAAAQRRAKRSRQVRRSKQRHG